VAVKFGGSIISNKDSIFANRIRRMTHGEQFILPNPVLLPRLQFISNQANRLLPLAGVSLKFKVTKYYFFTPQL
jgi:hypothetical protein